MVTFLNFIGIPHYMTTFPNSKEILVTRERCVTMLAVSPYLNQKGTFLSFMEIPPCSREVCPLTLAYTIVKKESIVLTK